MSSQLKEERRTFHADVARAAPWPEAPVRKLYRTKVFKSGNSIAVRIPAGTELKPGMEMDLTVEEGVMLTLKPIDAPKRRIDVSSFWGKAKSLRVPDRRDFEERPSAIAARKAASESGMA